MKRRLLFVDHVTRILGGAEVNLVEFLGEAAERGGVEVAVACDPRGRLHEALADAGVERHAFGFDDTVGTLRLVGRRFPLIRALPAMRALARARRQLDGILQSVRPDAVISCTNKDHFATWPAARRHGIPSVWWVNDIVSADFFPWLARQAFVHQAGRGAARCVVVSDFAREALVAAGVGAERVVTIHNGIPLARYLNPPRGHLRRQLQITREEPLVGILGRLTPWKGQEFFLELAEAWCARQPRGQFALIGHAFNEDQGFEQRLREFVRSRGLRERVHFVPFQKDAAAALADLDLLVHASLKPEPFGRVVIEAMAVGVPVLAARGGGVPEIITDGKDGLLAPPGDREAYAHQLARVLGEPPLRLQLIEAGHRTVRERFTLARVREQFHRLITSLR